MSLSQISAMFASVVIMGDSADVSVPWAFAMDPLCQRVAAGDIVTFTWTGSHNVATVPSMADFEACTNPTEVGAVANGGEYVWTADTSKYFICSVTGHCRPHEASGDG